MKRIWTPEERLKVGKKIARLRDRQHLTFEELGERFSVSTGLCWQIYQEAKKEAEG